MMRRASDDAQLAVAAMSREHVAAVEKRLKKFEKISSEQMAAEKEKLKSIEDKHKSSEQALEEKLEAKIAGLQNRIDSLSVTAAGRVKNHAKVSVRTHDSASENEYYYDNATATAAPATHGECRCIGGEYLGAECTFSNHHKKWCYVADVTACKETKNGNEGPFSEEPCYADRSGSGDPFAVPSNFNKDEYQGPCPPADPICTGQNDTDKEELNEEIYITEEMIREVANYRCCENRTTSNMWKYHLKAKSVKPYCKEKWFKSHCLDVNGKFMPFEGAPAPNLTDSQKMDECEVCNSCFKTKTEKDGKQKCKFWDENQVSIPDYWTKAISDEQIAAAHNGEDLSKFTNSSDDDKLAEECDGPFANKDGETCSNFYIAEKMYPLVGVAAICLLLCCCGMGGWAYYGDEFLVMIMANLGMKPKVEEKKEEGVKKKKKKKPPPPPPAEEEAYAYAEEEAAPAEEVDDVLKDLDAQVEST